jgi:hydrogenase-4 component B
MPWTAALLAVGSAGIAVLPPLNGFVSEWLLYLGLFDAAGGPPAIAAAILPATIALCLSGALALAAFVKASALVLLGAPRSRAASGLHECGWWMRGPMVALAGTCLFTATAPTLVWPLVAQAVGAWRPAWNGAALPASVAALGRIQLGLIVALVAAAAALRLRVGANGLRRALTWDCGYAAPTARMQYTGGSFAAITSGWFRRVVRSSRIRRRPRGPFPARADHEERVADPVYDGVLEPAAGAILRASSLARRLQHGHLPDYVLYHVVGLAAVAAIVVIGAAS